MAPPPPTSSQSRATTASGPPPPSARPPAPAPMPEAPAPPSLPPWDYRYVITERSKSWPTVGRKAVVEDAIAAVQEESHVVICEIFQELSRAGLEGKLEPTEAGDTIREILGNPQAETYGEISSLFLDTLCTIMESMETLDVAIAPLLKGTSIPPTALREQLDASLLKALGMIRPTFDKVLIRHQTNLLYRQSNYNLLREESEGYSKLVTELFTTSNKVTPTAEVVEDTFERIKALIGAFDLDVGRVLDVTLDVFASVLVREYRFFIKFLRASSWWPKEQSLQGLHTTHQGFSGLPHWAHPGSSNWVSTEEERDSLEKLKEQRDQQFWDRARDIGVSAFFELGERRVAQEKGGSNASHSRLGINTGSNEADEWIRSTGTLPPPGNRVAAQLLGFKLRFYASEARDPSDVLPDNLVYLAALLIKIGFISLRDLYPHLYPPDEAMVLIRERQMKENAEREKIRKRGGGGNNALAMAGVLSDDTLPPPLPRLREADANRATPTRSDAGGEKTVAPPAKSVEPEEEKEKLPEPADQKVVLLKSLLAIGAIPEALYILGRFPWLPDAFPDLHEHIHRILHVCLSKLSATVQPAASRGGLIEPKAIYSDQITAKGQIRQAEAPPRRVLRWAQIDKSDVNEGNDYRFYWDDWADNVPVCQTVDDVFTLCDTFMNYTRAKIGHDPSLLTKLARIGKKSVLEDTSQANLDRWVDLCKRLLTPALSLIKGNPGVVNEVFDLLKCFNTKTRYDIYAEWYHGEASRHPDIRAAFEFAKKQTSDVMKRVSIENTKPMARVLTKVAYSSPGVVFSFILNQIESYENMVPVVVECSRYLTYLAYDVLSWSVVSALGGRGRKRKQADGMLTSGWLQHLSDFAGMIFKRHSTMNPSPVLQYVAEQLQQDNPTDLEILRQIIQNMAGIAPEMLFNDAQINAMAGGQLLQAQTLLQLHDQRHNLKSSSKRLMRSLAEPGLTGRLLISIAQQRQTFVFQQAQDDDPLKPLGENLDRIHGSFIQYLEMLQSNLSAKEFESAVPDVLSLISDFHLDPPIAFTICRQTIAQAVAQHDASMRIERQQEHARRLSSGKSAEKVQVNGDVEMKDGAIAASSEDGAVDEGDPEVAPIEVEEGEQKADTIEMKDVLHAAELQNSASSLSAVANGNEDPWHPALKPLFTQLRSVLPADFETNFNLPFYVTFWQLSLADMLVPSPSYEEESKRIKDRVNVINAEKHDNSGYAIRKVAAARKPVMDLFDRLRAELKSQIQTHTQVRARLNKEKDHWFTSFYGRWDALNEKMLQECFFPRIILSPLDAHFSFRMLFFLHSSGAPCFRTMGFIDRFLKERQMTSMIFLCTLREAENLGRFLNELLKEMARWHADKAVYEKVAYGTKRDLPGFAKKLPQDSVPTSFMEFEDFRRLLYKWHRNLNGAFKACFGSGEYMHVMNGIVILNQVHKYFPAVNWMGSAQINSISELKSDERADVKLAANSLLTNLQRAEKQWVMPQAFYIPESQSSAHKGASRASSMRPDTPRPAVPQSKPADTSTADQKPEVEESSIQAPPAEGLMEDTEDGEVEDTRTSVVKPEDTVSVGATPGLEDRPTAVQAGPDQPPTESTSIPPAQNPEPLSKGSHPHESDMKQEQQKQPVNSTTPASGEPNAVPRPTVERTSSAASVPGRQAHLLPNRPQNQSLPGYPRLPDRPPRTSSDFANSRREGRPPTYADNGSLERPGDLARSAVNEHRESSPGRGMRPGTPDGRIVGDRAHEETTYQDSRDFRKPRLDGPDLRRSQRDLYAESRGQLWDRQSREIPSQNDSHGGLPSPEFEGRANGPARMQALTSDVGPRPGGTGLINTERTAQVGVANQRTGSNTLQTERVSDAASRISANPARAALINGSLDHHNEGFPGELGDRRARLLRPSSPPRRDDHGPFQDGYREDRLGTQGRAPPRGFPKGRQLHAEAGAATPQGPRFDRGGRANFSEVVPLSRSTELLPPAGGLRTPDLSHGRLTKDFSPPSRQPDANYGRLNGGSEAPSGPRRRNSFGRGWGMEAAQTPVNLRQADHPTPPLAQAQSHSGPPSGPASDRRDRGSSNYDRPPPGSASAPSTPVIGQTQPEAAGVHPSRLRNISNLSSGPNAQPQQNNSALGMAAPPAIPPPAGPKSDHRGVPPPSNPAPSATNAYPTNPGLPSAPPRNAPSGPASAAERRRWASLQDTLHQAGSSPASMVERSDRGASILGRAGRQNNLTPEGQFAPQLGIPQPPLSYTKGRPPSMADGPAWRPEATGERDASFFDRNGERKNEPLSGGVGPEAPSDSRRRGEGGKDGERPSRFGRHKESREGSRERYFEDERRDRREEGGRENRDARRVRDDGRERGRKDGRDGRDVYDEDPRRGGAAQQEAEHGGFGGGEPTGRGIGEDRKHGRDRRAGGDDRRDLRKRGRGMEENFGPFGDSKRPRRMEH